MSEFIREVNEDYRRDRVVAFFVNNRAVLVGLAVATIVGIAGYRFYLHSQNQAAEAASVRYEAALALVRDGKGVEGQAAFDRIQADGPSGYASLARLKAVETLALRDPAAAARGYDAMASDDTMEASLRDVARFRGALIRVDSEDPTAFEKRYAPFATSGFAFHSALRELLALAAFKRNDMEAAGRWLDQIVIDQQAPAALRGRAEAFLGLVAAGPAKIGTPEAPAPVIPTPPDGTGPATPTTASPATPPSSTTAPSSSAAPPPPSKDAPSTDAPSTDAPPAVATPSVPPTTPTPSPNPAGALPAR